MSRPEPGEWQRRLHELLRGDDKAAGENQGVCTCDECMGIGQDGLS